MRGFSRSVAGVVMMTCLMWPRAGLAQQLDEAYILNHLGPAAEQTVGSPHDPTDGPTMIGIGQYWQIGPAFGVRESEAWWVVNAAASDCPYLGGMACVAPEVEALAAGHIAPMRSTATLLLARFATPVGQGITCNDRDRKAAAAQRLSEALGRISQLYVAGAGVVAGFAGVVTRFVGPLGFAATVTGFASAWAAQLAAAYRNAPCWTGGGGHRWELPSRIALLSPDPSRTSHSSHGRPGLPFAAPFIGPITPGREARSASASR